MPWWGILIIVAAAVAAALIILTRIGKKTQKQQALQEEQIRQTVQTVNILVIDKKKMRLKDAGLPQIVIDQSPKMMRRAKMPVVKAKVGPKITTFLCKDKEVYDLIPIRKEVKAQISGLLIVSVKGIRKPLVSDNAKKKQKKKNGTFETLLRKGRGEI